MDALALRLLGIAPAPTPCSSVVPNPHARCIRSYQFTGTVVRDRIKKIEAVLSNNFAHDTHAIAKRIGVTTKQAQQALTQMCSERKARKCGTRSVGMARIAVWRKL